MIIFLIIIVIAVILFAVMRLTFSTSLTRNQLSSYAYDTLELSDGMRVNYRRSGNHAGPAILLIHGGTDSQDVWDPWIRVLGDRYCVITPDLPGHGLTEPLPDDDYTPDRFSRFIKDFADTLSLRDFVIGGHSYGGDSVLRFVIGNPRYARAMVLVSPGGYKPERAMKMNKSIVSILLGPLGGFLRTHIGTRFMMGKGFLKFFFRHRTPATEANIDRQALLWRYEKNRGAALMLVLNGETGYREVSGTESVDMPVLLLWGREDRISPIEVGERLALEIPNAKLKVYEDMGHMSHVECAEETAREAREFLDALPDTG